uniref:CSD domain-containing protein n=1 Tax=Amorphochlora amoebiformis TaxID=1561963 RepID=A0A7S0DG15_9EUKA
MAEDERVKIEGKEDVPAKADGEGDKEEAKKEEEDKRVSITEITLTDKEGNKIVDGSELVLLRTVPETGVPQGSLKEMEESKVLKGKVKNWITGYGFVNTEGLSEDVFVHWKSIRSKKEAFRELCPGDTVLYRKETNAKGGPVGQDVRVISSLHLAYAKPFKWDQPKGDIQGTPLELIQHPKVEKREFAPLKARVKSSGTEIGSARKVDDNRLFLLFNRNNVSFTGIPTREMDKWETFRKEVKDFKTVEASMIGQKMSDFQLKNLPPRVSRKKKREDRFKNFVLRGDKKKELQQHKKTILTFLESGKAVSRSCRISKIRDKLPKDKFNPMHYGMNKFTDLLKQMPEIVFLNENKVALRDQYLLRTKGQKRKATDTPDHKTQQNQTGGKKAKTESTVETMEETKD